VFQAASRAKLCMPSWLLVAEVPGGPKYTTTEVDCNTVGQIGWRTIVVDKVHDQTKVLDTIVVTLLTDIKTRQNVIIVTNYLLHNTLTMTECTCHSFCTYVIII